MPLELRKLPPWSAPLALAIVALVATLATLAPEAGGPAVTCDEPYHVAYGKGLVLALRTQGVGFVLPENIRRNFPWRPDGPPAHPPLGHWLLGAANHLFDVAPDNRASLSIVAARFVPAAAFAALVLLVGLWMLRLEGPVAGTAAAAAVALTPRLFGHAHLAALDMVTATFCVAALAAAASAETRGPRAWPFLLAGAVWGLAMLVRLHGALLGAPIAAWIAWRFGRRALVPLLAWLGGGLVTLYAGWPWLWLAPWRHLRQFLMTSTSRQAIQVYYLGQPWSDHQAPRHYALATFAVALPLGLLALGALGLWARRRMGRAPAGLVLIVVALASVLLAFSLPGAPVYDGERLFLVALPLWAALAGIGAKWLYERPRWSARPAWLRGTALALFLGAQGIGLALYHPCHLAHYSLLVGGLRGAERLGFEVDYWGQGATERLLAEAAQRTPGGRLLFAPNLAPYQFAGVQMTSAALILHDVALVPQDVAIEPSPRPPRGCRYAVVYRRQADLGRLPRWLREAPVVATESRQGTWIAKLVELP